MTVRRQQVLPFHASACDELTPPKHRAPPGQHAGLSLTGGTPIRCTFVPGPHNVPSFDAVSASFDASAVVRSCSSSRRTPDPLVAGLLPQRSPRGLLTNAACGGLGSPPARRTRRTYLHRWHSMLCGLSTFYVETTSLSGHTCVTKRATRSPGSQEPGSSQRYNSQHVERRRFELPTSSVRG